MFFAKYASAYASALALTASLASGCGPADLDGDSVRKALFTTGYGAVNSRQAFGGNINAQSVTGLFQSATPRGDGATSPTGYWMRSPTEDKYAPVLAISMDGLNITSVTAAQGVL